MIRASFKRSEPVYLLGPLPDLLAQSVSEWVLSIEYRDAILIGTPSARTFIIVIRERRSERLPDLRDGFQIARRKNRLKPKFADDLTRGTDIRNGQRCAIGCRSEIL